VELGTGLNTRFERAGTDQAHWIDLDLPDTIELRRRFFADSDPNGRRRMLAASVLDQDWMPAVQESPGPYFFVADGVLAYLDQAPQVIARIAGTFPGALIAFDTYSQRTLEQQHKLAARKNMDALWAWSCDDPRTLESLGLEVVQQAAVMPGRTSRMTWWHRRIHRCPPNPRTPRERCRSWGRPGRDR
jgi:O-methyltransferase involved in polyketide biosynthesis